MRLHVSASAVLEPPFCLLCHTRGAAMVALKMQKRLAASVLDCGKRKVREWLVVSP